MRPAIEISPAHPEGQRLLGRRELLRLSAGGLLALGLGSASAAESHGFKFIVVNDIHGRDERCYAWFKILVANMRTHKPEFVVINGDLTEYGQVEQFKAVKEVFGSLGVPLYATLGNHDYITPVSHAPFDEVFPNSLNYHFHHGGWQFIGLDSTDGQGVVFTHIQPATFTWLDATLPALDRNKPTVVITHFPLGQAVLCRPFNADDILNRFNGFNLRATFSGHWHGYAERHFEHATITNSRCASWWRSNNDGSPQKGYFLCETTASGELNHEFHPVDM